MKSTQSIYPRLVKVAVAVSIATASLGGASAIAAGVAPEAEAAGASHTILDTDRLIVKYKDATVGAAARVATAMTAGRQAIADRAGQQLGLRLQALRSTATGAHVFKIDRKVSVKEAAALAREMMARDTMIEYAEPDLIMRKMATPTDPMYTQQWHYYEATGGLRLPAAWDLSTGTGVKVAVIDTGIRPHADLVGQYVGGYDFISDAAIGNDGNGRDADPTDPGDWTAANECAAGDPGSNSSWHGTHVAGTIAAATNNGTGVSGVAYGAKVVPVRVLGKCGGYTSDIADAIIWASGGTVSGVPANANVAKVINMSLGGGGACGTTTQNAINSARSRGTVVVVAAGNENQNASNSNPANCAGVVTVAATNRNGARAPYSNYGAVVDVAAPGGDANGYILSTLNAGTQAPGADNYAGYQGTSMATPHVAGVAALMLARNSALTPDEIEAKLKSTARPFPGTCSQCGTGIVDAGAAVAAATTTTPTAPTPTAPTISETESNNTISTANAIATAGTTVNGNLRASTDTDYFVVQLPAGKTLTASLTQGATTNDYDLYIYNSAGTQLTKSENGAGATDSASVVNNGSSSAAVYARVKYYSGGTGATNGKYTLKASW
jgi:serine protease